TDATGAVATDSTGQSMGNDLDGIRITAGGMATFGNMIGGTVAGSRNVIANNGGDGVAMYIDLAVGAMNRVMGNYVGTNATGTSAMGNHGAGVVSWGNAGVDIEHNVISGNARQGLVLIAGSMLKGNWIGVGADHVSAMGNGRE